MKIQVASTILAARKANAPYVLLMKDGESDAEIEELRIKAQKSNPLQEVMVIVITWV